MMWKMVEGDEVLDEVDNGGLVNGFRCCLKLKKKCIFVLILCSNVHVFYCNRSYYIDYEKINIKLCLNCTFGPSSIMMQFGPTSRLCDFGPQGSNYAIFIPKYPNCYI